MRCAFFTLKWAHNEKTIQPNRHQVAGRTGHRWCSHLRRSAPQLVHLAHHGAALSLLRLLLPTVSPVWFGRHLAALATLATGAWEIKVNDSRSEISGMLDAGLQLAPSNQIGGSLSWNGISLQFVEAQHEFQEVYVLKSSK